MHIYEIIESKEECNVIEGVCGKKLMLEYNGSKYFSLKPFNKKKIMVQETTKMWFIFLLKTLNIIGTISINSLLFIQFFYAGLNKNMFLLKIKYCI